MKRRLSLARHERDAVAAGAWIRVVTSKDGAATALVGAVKGELRAYVNVCRHQAIPLDLPVADEVPPDGAAAPAPTTDDGRHLICLRHGALYRLDDGVCVDGPCEGEALLRLTIVREGEEVALELG